jgi:site-specific DNA-cytosine methylase
VPDPHDEDGGTVNIIECFACAGGMSEGFRRAGLPVSIAFDYSADACDSHERNLGQRPIQMDVRDLLRMVQAGWRPLEGMIDLAIFDPPCTPWSRAGKRAGVHDERDMIEDTIDLIGLLRPRAWLIANVPGLDDGPNLETVQRTIGSLSKLGYCIDFARLNASSYGVPQHRIRPWWYGHDMRTPHVVWPAPTHCDPADLHTVALPGVDALKPWVTCRQALQHLPAKDLGSPVRLRWRGANGKQVASIPDRPARVVGTSNLSDGNVLAHPDDAIKPKDKRSQREPGRKARGSRLDEPAGVVTCKPESGDGTIVFEGDGLPLFDGTDAATVARKRGGRKWAVRATHVDQPAGTLTCSTGANGRNLYAGDELAAREPGDVTAFAEHHQPSRDDRPSRTITGNTHGDGSVLQIVEVPHHPPSEMEEPSRVIRASGGGTPDKILRVNGRHPINEADAPSVMVTARDRGAQGANAMHWPWDRPSTTLQKDDRLPEPGHHDENWLNAAGERSRSTANAVKLSLRAAAILQGFPDGDCDGHPSDVRALPGTVCPECGKIRRWHLCGATKLAKWSQLGQAMPAPFAHAVALSIKRQMGSR